MQGATHSTLPAEVLDDVSRTLTGTGPRLSDPSFAFRLAWSLGSRRATASLFDISANADADVAGLPCVSLHHFKRAFTTVFEAAAAIWFPDRSLPSADKCAEAVSVLLTDCGHVVRHPYYIACPPLRHAACRTEDGPPLILARGFGPGLEVLMSGSGAFLKSAPTDLPEQSATSFRQFFGIPDETPEDRTRRLFEAVIEWRPHKPLDGEDWTYFDPCTSSMPWHPQLPSARLSLARLQGEAHTEFTLLRRIGEYVQECRLPDFMTPDVPELVIGTLLMNGIRPPLIFTRPQPGLVLMNWTRHPPLPLRHAVALYSWPDEELFQDNPSDFRRRLMNEAVFGVFAREAERIGYRIEEKETA